MSPVDHFCTSLYALCVAPRKPRRTKRAALGEPSIQAAPSRAPEVIVAPTPTTAPRVLTPRELANFLKVSPATVRRLLRRGELPHINVGNRVRFVPGEVLEKLRKS